MLRVIISILPQLVFRFCSIWVRSRDINHYMEMTNNSILIVCKQGTLTAPAHEQITHLPITQAHISLNTLQLVEITFQSIYPSHSLNYHHCGQQVYINCIIAYSMDGTSNSSTLTSRNGISGNNVCTSITADCKVAGMAAGHSLQSLQFVQL